MIVWCVENGRIKASHAVGIREKNCTNNVNYYRAIRTLFLQLDIIYLMNYVLI